MKPAQEQIRALRQKVRTLQETVEVYDLNYSYLADLVNDAACRLKEGEPIDPSVLEAFMRLEWQDDGRIVHLADSQRVTSFSAQSRHAAAPARRPRHPTPETTGEEARV